MAFYISIDVLYIPLYHIQMCFKKLLYLCQVIQISSIKLYDYICSLYFSIKRRMSIKSGWFIKQQVTISCKRYVEKYQMRVCLNSNGFFINLQLC